MPKGTVAPGKLCPPPKVRGPGWVPARGLTWSARLAADAAGTAIPTSSSAPRVLMSARRTNEARYTPVTVTTVTISAYGSIDAVASTALPWFQQPRGWGCTDRHGLWIEHVADGRHPERRHSEWRHPEPVSYTHLTLPTIYSV